MTYEPTAEFCPTASGAAVVSRRQIGHFHPLGVVLGTGMGASGRDIDKQVAEKGWEAMFANNPYAEWYLNSLRLGDTPTARHHAATYGENFAMMISRPCSSKPPKSGIPTSGLRCSSRSARATSC